MGKESGKEREWVGPKYDERGLTQWYWRVLYPENLVLGRNVQIGSFTVIDAMKGVRIDDNVRIGFGCTIISYSSIDEKEGKVVLEKDCKVGSNTVIMPGVRIGSGTIVGANSFVNRDIPPNEIWVGTPARFLKRIDRKGLAQI